MAKLADLRRQRLLTQKALATKAQVAVSTVHLIEVGRTRPRLEVMRRICDALGVGPSKVDEFMQTIKQG